MHSPNAYSNSVEMNEGKGQIDNNIEKGQNRNLGQPKIISKLNSSSSVKHVTKETNLGTNWKK